VEDDGVRNSRLRNNWSYVSFFFDDLGNSIYCFFFGSFNCVAFLVDVHSLVSLILSLSLTSFPVLLSSLEILIAKLIIIHLLSYCLLFYLFNHSISCSRAYRFSEAHS